MSAFGEETVKQQAYLERSPSALNGRQSDVQSDDNSLSTPFMAGWLFAMHVSMRTPP